MNSIEEILKNESLKLNERSSTEILISIPSELVRGIFKYKKGEVIKPIGGLGKFIYLGLSVDGHDFQYIKDEII